MRVAIIPARGGSQRIPGKNIKDFCGKPMIAWSIHQALASQCFDQVIVSTDDTAIQTIAQAYGARTPFLRPDHLSDPFTGTQAVIKHGIEWLSQHETAPTLVCGIYATAPFVQAHFLQQGLQTLMLAPSSQYAFSVTSFAYPIGRALTLIDQNRIQPFFPENTVKRSQDLIEAVHDAGQFYWGKAEAFLNELPLFSPHSIGIRLPRHLVQDIDTPEDWLRAEFMFKALVEAGELTQ